jgi:hypothetical protein
MSENNFIDGLIVKAPHQNAPDFVKAKLSIKREDLIGWLQQQTGEWINADIKESRAGKWYAAIDNWKPDGDRVSTPSNDRSASANGTSDGPPVYDGPPVFDNPPPAADFDDDIPF